MPMRPATCAMTGPRLAGNQREPSRSTLMKVIASPQPSSARQASAAAYDSENAKPNWPAVKSTTPSVSTFLVPSLSTSSPTGICMPA